MIRKPAVSGSFYPSSPSSLDRILRALFEEASGAVPRPNLSGPRAILGLMVPHAGYQYSGAVAAAGYSRLARDGVPETFVLVGPNHWGLGPAVSVFPEGTWLTPLGAARVDSELAAIIASEGPAEADELAHLREHSIEVQIPFLQMIYGSDVRIVPIAMRDQSFETSSSLAGVVREAAERLGRDVVVIASSDMTHYEPQERAVRKDRWVLEALTSMDEREFYRRVVEGNVSMCGPGPAVVALVFSKLSGASRAELVRYSTSGDVTGDYLQVVGYASVVFER